MRNRVARIGYQGIPGSYSHIAAMLFAEALGSIGAADGSVLVPLVSPAPVLERLIAGRIEYGVVATRNTSCGEVSSTAEALLAASGAIRHARSLTMMIRHCLCTKHGVGLDEIGAVASHEQALRQCSASLQLLLRKAPMIIEEPDTAIAAKRLAEGTYDRSIAVVCSEEAAIAYGLSIAAHDVNDDPANATTFALLKARRWDGSAFRPINTR